MSYKSFEDGSSYLALFLKPYRQVNGIESEPTAFLYGGPETPLPSWVPGLIAAGRAKVQSKKESKNRKGDPWSPGAVFHRLVKEKYQGQTIKGAKVRELKEMMK